MFTPTLSSYPSRSHIIIFGEKVYNASRFLSVAQNANDMNNYLGDQVFEYLSYQKVMCMKKMKIYV